MAKIINLQSEYSSKQDVERDLSLYNADKAETDKLYYLSYWNGDKHKRLYVPCTKETFSAWRNMLSAEHKKRDAELRCRVLSKRYKNKYIVCREDCNRCPYGKEHRDKPFLRLGDIAEDVFLSSDDYSCDPYSAVEEREDRERLHSAMSGLKKEDRKILVLFSNGLSDAQIGKEMGLAKSTVQYRRSRLIEILRKKLEEN